MDASPRAISPLRQRMIDDMRMRKLSEKTQSHYLRWVQRFAAYLGRSPDTATVEDAFVRIVMQEFQESANGISQEFRSTPIQSTE